MLKCFSALYHVDISHVLDHENIVSHDHHKRGVPVFNLMSETHYTAVRADGMEDYGWETPGQHRVFDRGATDGFFEEGESLGQGSIGFVQEVRVKNAKLKMVRKQVFLAWGQNGRQKREILEKEVEVLNTLSHVHVVSLVGTFEGKNSRGGQFYSILMTPVGNQDLGRFLYNLPSEPLDIQDTQRRWIREWFQCLVSALAFIHANGIRHEDIKPSNIIHLGRRILFTDFSSSTRYSVGRTTSTDSPTRVSFMYAAPEAQIEPTKQNTTQRRGLGSDIFSLGCVFAEMLSVLLRKSVEEFQDFCLDRPGASSSSYCQSLDNFDKWFFSDEHSTIYPGVYSYVVMPMISTDRKARPDAGLVLQRLQTPEIRALLPCNCFCHFVSPQTFSLRRFWQPWGTKALPALLNSAKIPLCRVIDDLPSAVQTTAAQDDLFITKGHVVAVLNDVDALGNLAERWYCVNNRGHIGYVPGACVGLIQHHQHQESVYSADLHGALVNVLWHLTPEELKGGLIHLNRNERQGELTLATHEKMYDIFLRIYQHNEDGLHGRRDNTPNGLFAKTAATMAKEGPPGLEGETLAPELSASHPLDELSPADLNHLAKHFADSLPENKLSLAELQSFLLTYENDPLRALGEVGPWSEALLEAKEMKAKVATRAQSG